jgi:predicted RNase H-like nuclease (RuvC/YqgF family)
MRSTTIATLLLMVLVGAAHSQAASGKHGTAFSAAVVRVKALQNQVESQQTEIDTLKLRLARLQQEFHELAEMFADQSADSDDDDSDDSDVTPLRVHSRTKGSSRNARIVCPVAALSTDNTPSHRGIRGSSSNSRQDNLTSHPSLGRTSY